MSDRIHVTVVDAPGASPSDDVEALRRQPGVSLTTARHVRETGEPNLLLLPDTTMVWGRWWDPWRTRVDALPDTLVLGIGAGLAVLARPPTGAFPGWGLIDALVTVDSSRPPVQRRGRVMGADVLAVESAVKTVAHGPDAAGWVHLEDRYGREEEGAVRTSDARLFGTGLVGLLANPAFLDVFLTEVGRRCGLTFVA